MISLIEKFKKLFMFAVMFDAVLLAACTFLLYQVNSFWCFVPVIIYMILLGFLADRLTVPIECIDEDF